MPGPSSTSNPPSNPNQTAAAVKRTHRDNLLDIARALADSGPRGKYNLVPGRIHEGMNAEQAYQAELRSRNPYVEGIQQDVADNEDGAADKAETLKSKIADWTYRGKTKDMSDVFKTQSAAHLQRAEQAVAAAQQDLTDAEAANPRVPADVSDAQRDLADAQDQLRQLQTQIIEATKRKLQHDPIALEEFSIWQAEAYYTDATRGFTPKYNSLTREIDAARAAKQSDAVIQALEAQQAKMESELANDVVKLVQHRLHQARIKVSQLPATDPLKPQLNQRLAAIETSREYRGLARSINDKRKFQDNLDSVLRQIQNTREIETNLRSGQSARNLVLRSRIDALLKSNAEIEAKFTPPPVAPVAAAAAAAAGGAAAGGAPAVPAPAPAPAAPAAINPAEQTDTTTKDAIERERKTLKTNLDTLKEKVGRGENLTAQELKSIDAAEKATQRLIKDTNALGTKLNPEGYESVEDLKVTETLGGKSGRPINSYQIALLARRYALAAKQQGVAQGAAAGKFTLDYTNDKGEVEAHLDFDFDAVHVLKDAVDKWKQDKETLLKKYSQSEYDRHLDALREAYRIGIRRWGQQMVEGLADTDDEKQRQAGLGAYLFGSSGELKFDLVKGVPDASQSRMFMVHTDILTWSSLIPSWFGIGKGSNYLSFSAQPDPEGNGTMLLADVGYIPRSSGNLNKLAAEMVRTAVFGYGFKKISVGGDDSDRLKEHLALHAFALVQALEELDYIKKGEIEIDLSGAKFAETIYGKMQQGEAGQENSFYTRVQEQAKHYREQIVQGGKESKRTTAFNELSAEQQMEFLAGSYDDLDALARNAEAKMNSYDALHKAYVQAVDAYHNARDTGAADVEARKTAAKAALEALRNFIPEKDGVSYNQLKQQADNARADAQRAASRNDPDAVMLDREAQMAKYKLQNAASQDRYGNLVPHRPGKDRLTVATERYQAEVAPTIPSVKQPAEGDAQNDASRTASMRSRP